jgi:hypothetical protein
MSKVSAILLSSLFLIQSFNLHVEDIYELNEVFEHAELHKQRYGDNFFVFLSKHYGDLKDSHKQQHQKEEEEHNHPPINHDCSSQIQTVFVLNTFSFSIENPKQTVEASTNFYYQDKFSTFEKQKIFQPPKLT